MGEYSYNYGRYERTHSLCVDAPTRDAAAPHFFYQWLNVVGLVEIDVFITAALFEKELDRSLVDQGIGFGIYPGEDELWCIHLRTQAEFTFLFEQPVMWCGRLSLFCPHMPVAAPMLDPIARCLDDKPDAHVALLEYYPVFARPFYDLAHLDVFFRELKHATVDRYLAAMAARGYPMIRDPDMG